jgi:hypothetical protein
MMVLKMEAIRMDTEYTKEQSFEECEARCWRCTNKVVFEDRSVGIYPYVDDCKARKHYELTLYWSGKKRVTKKGTQTMSEDFFEIMFEYDESRFCPWFAEQYPAYHLRCKECNNPTWEWIKDIKVEIPDYGFDDRCLMKCKHCGHEQDFDVCAAGYDGEV